MNTITVDAEQMAARKADYDRWYAVACGIALKFGEGTAISVRAPDVNGVYPDPVITTPSGLSFTVGRPLRQEP